MPAVGYHTRLIPDAQTDVYLVEGKHPLVNHIYEGDCREVLSQFELHTIDLIVTSPPYADQRKHTYGGIPPDRYVEWFLPIAAEVHRVLKPRGSFVLNVKERVIEGERHTDVIELILAMRRQGWLWTEEYCWHKRNCYPAKWPNRFRMVQVSHAHRCEASGFSRSRLEGN